jgi:hypothetical protein
MKSLIKKNDFKPLKHDTDAHGATEQSLPEYPGGQPQAKFTPIGIQIPPLDI